MIVILFCVRSDVHFSTGIFVIPPVTQPAVNGPFSCFDTSRRTAGRRTLTVELNDAGEGGDGGSGYLASAITDRTGAGSAGCPWLLRASPWQRINVTLIDFSDSATLDGGTEAFGYSIVLGETDDATGSEHAAEQSWAADLDGRRPGDHRPDELITSDGQRQQHTDADGNKLQELHLRTFCHKYAVVRERQTTSSRETVVCGDKARRKVVYLSAGNEVEVELIRPTSNDADDEHNEETPTKQPAVFLLRYDSQCFALHHCYVLFIS